MDAKNKSATRLIKAPIILRLQHELNSSLIRVCTEVPDGRAFFEKQAMRNVRRHVF